MSEHKTTKQMVSEIYVAMFGSNGVRGIIQRMEKVEKVIDENASTWAFWKDAKRIMISALIIISGGGVLALIRWGIKLYSTH